MTDDAKEIARAVSLTLLEYGQKYDNRVAFVEYCMDAVAGLHAATHGPLKQILLDMGHDPEIADQITNDSLALVYGRLKELAQD